LGSVMVICCPSLLTSVSSASAPSQFLTTLSGHLQEPSECLSSIRLSPRVCPSIPGGIILLEQEANNTLPCEKLHPLPLAQVVPWLP
jgi:hypothetical protein